MIRTTKGGRAASLTRRTCLVLAGCLALATLAGCASAGGGAREAEAPLAKLLLVAGATGGTGRHIVEQALAAGYRVRALVRDEARARTLFGDRVQYAVGNVRDPATLAPAVAGVDYVISAIGSNSSREPENTPERIDYRGIEALASAAKQAGVKHFVLVSSMGVTNPDHLLNRILDGLMRWKLAGENALRASGVPYTIVRPGGLKDGAGGEGLRVMQGDPRDVVGRIARADVAAVTVQALGRADAMAKTFEILGDPGVPRPDWERFFAALRADAG